MALKINFSRLDQLSRDELTALKALNENYTKLEKLLDTLLSRDGLYPNQMQADLDMNHKKIINVESGPGDNDVVTRKDIKDLIAKVEQAIKDLSTLYEQALKGLDLYNQEIIKTSIAELEEKLNRFYESLDNLVDKTSKQTITGEKTFTAPVIVTTPKTPGSFAASTVWTYDLLDETIGDIEAVIDAINGTSTLLLGAGTLTKADEAIFVDATTGFKDAQLVHLKSDASEAIGQSSVVFEDVDGSKCRVGHYMTSDRYGIQTAIHNDAFEDTQGTETDCVVSQQYVTNVGKVINDYSMSDSLLVPSVSVTSKSNQAASTEHVSQKIQYNVKVHDSDPVGSADNGALWVNTTSGKVYLNVGGANEWIMLSGTSYTSN
jgi:hypothetical protein